MTEPSPNGKVVLGLSDGVDSAVSAYILKRRGFEVLGLYMDIGGPQGREAALASAAQTGIPLKILNVSDSLNEYVCRPFAEAYIHGRTPNPCIVCNPLVKLKSLTDYADAVGAGYIATGHYIRSDGERLYMGSADNDQSYMFQRVTREQVRRLILPLGDKNKAEVRKLARKRGLACADRADSRDSCFIKDMDCAAWIEQNFPARVPPEGDVLLDGRVLARHKGIHHFTVGQRWPEDSEGRRLYVSELDAGANTVTLCRWEDLFRRELTVSGLHFISGTAPTREFSGFVRVRHTRRETPECRVTLEGTSAHIVTHTPVRAPAPGQPVALYQGDMLLGGGFVESECKTTVFKAKFG